MFLPKSRVRYVPSVGPVRPATILAKVSDVDAYTIRLACGRKLTVHASQLRANPASQIQPKIELRPEGAWKVIDMSADASIRTWSDGFGRWHASVPVVGTVGEQERNARKAIRAELEARGEVGKGYRIRLACVGESQQCSPDRRVYREA